MMKDRLRPQTIFAAVCFALLAGVAYHLAPSNEIAVVLGILLLTIFLFAFEVVAVDVAAISVMVLLGLVSYFGEHLGWLSRLVSNKDLFSGFSSNAVISIIAVMIIGSGLDKTGLMSKAAEALLRLAGRTEQRIIPAVAGTTGIISSFMQNVGAAALFLPVVSRVAARTGIPLSRLLMPMGFCAILGGTVTMVGSSPLILLNDLIMVSNQALPAGQQMQPWSMFSVTPIGLALLLTGIVYFVLAGRLVLPAVAKDDASSGTTTMAYFKKLYGLDHVLREALVMAESPLIGQQLSDIEAAYRLRVITILRGRDDLRIGVDGVAQDFSIEKANVLGLLGPLAELERFAADYRLNLRSELRAFRESLAPNRAGIAEVVIPPSSSLINKSARDIWMRKTYGLTLIALHRSGNTLGEGDGIRDLPLQAGDTLVVHTAWEALSRLKKNPNFVVVTSEYPQEETRPHKVRPALLFFGLALGLVLFSDIRLSLALMTGAIGMVVSGVLRIEEAYQAVSWKTVFLLASLIPLGLAVETSGTAAWIAQQTLALFDGTPIWLLQLAVAALATCFTLVISNVGATVLLVPLAVNLAIVAGADPAVFALTVALATSNSFFLPTHQVNALIMGPAGYRVADFMRAGGIMTLLFLLVMMLMMEWVL